MKVLVTGGAGYIGSILCPMLLEAGHQVVLLDNFMWGIHPILHFVNHPLLTVAAGDVRDRSTVRKLVSSADVVCHLAAIVGYPACAADPTLAETTNVEGTRIICDALSRQQVLIFASTGSTYGQCDTICTEQTPINPLTLYGRTKRDAERYVLGEGGIALRFATVFGLSPRLRLDLLINDFCYQAYHQKQIVIFEGHHRRTFLHARDAAAVYLFALERYATMRGEVFNVGSPEMNFTKIEAARMVQEQQPFYLHEASVGEDLDKRNYEVSYEKITALGYRSSVSMADGIKEVLRVVPHIRQRSEWRNAA